jgi:WD40 repeat protein
VAFSADGRTLAAGGSTGMIVLYTMPDFERRATIRAHADGVRSLCFAPDGRYLASAAIDVKVWEMPAGRELSGLFSNTPAADWATYTPDGRMIATGGNDDVVRLWRICSDSEPRPAATGSTQKTAGP